MNIPNYPVCPYPPEGHNFITVPANRYTTAMCSKCGLTV